MEKYTLVATIIGIFTGLFIAVTYQYHLEQAAAILTQITAGYLLYEFGLPPKRYHLAPGLLIGRRTHSQQKENLHTEFWSQIGIMLFILGQIVFLFTTLN